MLLCEIREEGVFRQNMHSRYYIVSHIALMLYPQDVRPEKNSLSSEAGVST